MHKIICRPFNQHTN